VGCEEGQHRVQRVARAGLGVHAGVVSSVRA
jgi:hypothetical protein